MPVRPSLVAAAALALLTAVVSVSATLTVSAAPNESEPEATPAEVPNFNRDIRPILSDHCFACHGPDEQQRKAGLRLDTEDGVLSIVDPDDAAASDLLWRVTSDDPDMIMPPPQFHKPLNDKQKALVRRWIEGGAIYQQHWAYTAPTRPEIPEISQQSGESPIDYFINRAAREAGLEPNGRADRRVLLRRVCLDLTGLPPTREQIEEFLSDESPEAYENLVDRLLQSPHFGQHAGRYWLDLVRYADTHGLHLDNYREMWPYRDWVIEAFNNNMPFDQFVTHQLAGDLLEDGGDSEKVASGFNRLNVTTNEGGSIYEEVFARNCIDRTDAFGTIFLGMTTGCAVCHDHKFDPITQHDYYSLLAFFNSLDGSAMDQNVKDHAPVIRVPTDEQEQQLAEFNQTLASLKEEMQGALPTVDAAQRRWEESLVNGSQGESHVLKPIEVTSQAEVAMEVRDDHSIALNGEPAAKDTTTIIAELPDNQQWQTLHLEAFPDKSDRVGVSSNGNVVLSEIVVETSDALSKGEWMPVPISHAFADVEQGNGPFAVTYAIDGKADADNGWAVAGHEQTGGRNAWFILPSLVADQPNTRIRVQLKYQSKYAQHQFQRIRLSISNTPPTVPEEKRIALGPIHRAGPFEVESANPGYGRKFASQQDKFNVEETFKHRDKSYSWELGDDLHPVDVHELPTLPDRASVTVLHQTITAPSDQKAHLLLGTDDGHVVYLNGKQIAIERGASTLRPLQHEYALELKAGENDLYIKLVNHRGSSQLTYAYRSPAIDIPEKLVDLLRKPVEERSSDEEAAIRKYYRKVYCLHPDWLALIDQQKGTEKARQQLQESVATTLVWKELEEPRQANVLIRGQYDQKGEEVERGTPPFLPPFPEDAPRDRRGLARWLLQPEHPLTSRVAVNRFWQQIFGTGLVKTSEDFGSQGQPPSHPELLDWLAVEFRESGWNVKKLIKSMVMSDAYRRSASMSDEMKRIDPENRLLARGPRHRLDGEVLRDQALALSGLLVDRMGGPSVKPPQPSGLWKAVGYSGSNTVRFSADSGEKIYRRSVYTFWKRTSPPPQMSTFDAPSRESCTARRERTNTPLQALLLMNEPQYQEASHHLALRALKTEGVESPQQRVEWLFETVTARLPETHEQQALVNLLEDLTRYYHEHPELASKLIDSSDAREAAWTVLASTLLNLDEVVSK